MPLNRASLDLLDRLSDQPPVPRPLNRCVVCGHPIKSVNGRALCGAAGHLLGFMAAHVAACAQCQKEMEINANQKQATEA